VQEQAVHQYPGRGSPPFKKPGRSAAGRGGWLFCTKPYICGELKNKTIMSLEKTLQERSENKCELCEATKDLKVYVVPPKTGATPDEAALICETCFTQIEDPAKTVAGHWRCLNSSMWSEVPAVKVIAWRMLDRLKAEGWPLDLLDQLYLYDETLAWAWAVLPE
jgi:hypothetical protein